MENKKLEKYKKAKINGRENIKVTSVNITLEQHEFIIGRGYNLSSFVRDKIDELILESKSKKKVS